jgi:hypothetical protein
MYPEVHTLAGANLRWSSVEAQVGSKVGVTFKDLAIRHMWEPRDDEEESLEALI